MIKIENTEVVGWESAIPIPIDGYESYKIDRYGNVYNKNKLVLKQEESNNGYMRVSLSNKQKHKKFLVHRLVAIAFIPNDNNFDQVNHKDKNKKNNFVENLEWCDCLYNLNYSNVIEKASVAKFRKIKCNETGEVFDSIKEATNKYNLSSSNIIACCNGRRKKCGGFTWSYQK